MTEPGTVTAATAAEWIMVTTRRLQQLVADGWIAKNPDGRYVTTAVVHGYIRSLKHDAKRSTASAARARGDDVKTKLAELRLARFEGKLIGVEEHLAIIDFITGAVRVELGNFPVNHTRDLAERDRLRDGLDGVLARLSTAAAKKAGELEGGADD